MFAPQQSQNKPFTICIEGNIGSGKTTFINHFEKFSEQICLITEPVDKWRNVGGINLLDSMYRDPQQWAMPFQSYVSLTMLQNHQMATNKPIKLMERSIYSSRYCFVENMYQSDILPLGMYNVLQEWYEYIDKSMAIGVDLIVYLRTTPEIVYERMQKRARNEECNVKIEYLRDLHRLHEQWLNGRENVVILNANVDLEKIASEYSAIADRIKSTYLSVVGHKINLF